MGAGDAANGNKTADYALKTAQVPVVLPWVVFE